jgi:hypothetical protein
MKNVSPCRPALYAEFQRDSKIVGVNSVYTNYARHHASNYFASCHPKNSSVAPYALIQLFHRRKP